MIMVNSDKKRGAPVGTAVVGIYYPNGVFCEDRENVGISYVLDHLLYDMLQCNIASYERCRILGHTYYGYSGYQVLCPSDKVDDIVERIDYLLYDDPWSDSNLSAWFELRKKTAHATPVPIENRYYSQCLPNEPLAKTISNRMNGVPSWDKLCEWRTKYIHKNRIACYITGGSYEDISREDGVVFPDTVLPVFSPNKITFPKHIPWQRTNIIYSVPYSLTATNVLVSEAYCEMLRSKIASTINSQGGQFCSVAFYPDYVPELRIHFHIKRMHEWSAVQQVEHNLADFQDLSSKRISVIKRRIYSFYCKMYENPIAWNSFAGYNLMSGNRYDLLGLRDLRTYEDQVTQESLNQVVANIQEEKERNIFMTAVR